MRRNKNGKHYTKSGRPPITETFISADAIIECYMKNHSMRKTAAELGIGVRTVFKYINEYAVPFSSGNELCPDLYDKIAHRPIAKDIANLGNLPRNPRKIVELLGNRYTVDMVKYHLYSRAKALEGMLREQGSLLKRTDVTLRDIYGRVINVGMFEMYTMKVDIFNLVVTLEATLKFGGKVTIRLSAEAFEEILKGKNPTRVNAPQRPAIEPLE